MIVLGNRALVNVAVNEAACLKFRLTAETTLDWLHVFWYNGHAGFARLSGSAITFP